MIALRKRAKTHDPNDYGPEIRTDLMREVAIEGTARVSRARVKDSLATMVQAGRISRIQYHAAECYRDDLDYMAGASGGDPDQRMTGVRGSSRSYGPSDLQVDAIGRVRSLRRLAGTDGLALVVCVEGGRSIAQLTTRVPCSVLVAERMLQGVLDMLAAFYEQTGER